MGHLGPRDHETHNCMAKLLLSVVRMCDARKVRRGTLNLGIEAKRVNETSIDAGNYFSCQQPLNCKARLSTWKMSNVYPALMSLPSLLVILFACLKDIPFHPYLNTRATPAVHVVHTAIQKISRSIKCCRPMMMSNCENVSPAHEFPRKIESSGKSRIKVALMCNSRK